MAMLRSLYRRLVAGLWLRLFLKALPARVDQAPAYGFRMAEGVVGANPEGDTFQIMSFGVYHGQKLLGVTQIWHNRNGAFAHFTDTTIGAS